MRKVPRSGRCRIAGRRMLPSSFIRPRSVARLRCGLKLSSSAGGGLASEYEECKRILRVENSKVHAGRAPELAAADRYSSLSPVRVRAYLVRQGAGVRNGLGSSLFLPSESTDRATKAG